VHQEQYVHDYPFCWRADNDPLIQYPQQSWFIRTSQFREQMLANNARIDWLPEHIKDGRFGNFLESNVDWALSRERYWGTPLPIWVCEETGQAEAVRSYADLLAKPGIQGADVFTKAKAANPDLSDDLRVHKPYIDAVTYDSPFAKASRMRRVTEVIDCWFDSGAMPFAQWGWPHQGHAEFDASSRPTSFRRRSTRPAAGSTASWQSARCSSVMVAVPTHIPSRPASSSATCSARTGRR
jgi:isoleucyl-tRNA synthetase